MAFGQLCAFWRAILTFSISMFMMWLLNSRYAWHCSVAHTSCTCTYLRIWLARHVNYVKITKKSSFHVCICACASMRMHVRACARSKKVDTNPSRRILGAGIFMHAQHTPHKLSHVHPPSNQPRCFVHVCICIHVDIHIIYIHMMDSHMHETNFTWGLVNAGTHVTWDGYAWEYLTQNPKTCFRSHTV